MLILGSFPSVMSRKTAFFYGHERNRFWRVLAYVCGEPVPTDIPAKKAMLLQNGIALWDVIGSCEIQGSADSSIRDVLPNDLSEILTLCPEIRIFTNGKTADAYYRRYQFPLTGIGATCLPSTSPANAAWSFEALCRVWSEKIRREHCILQKNMIE